ncbi:unnamed protein product [Sphagnum troendelagicum]|uniref:Uncharacterized protein n=1 Tax=Sphagnum troendelagicum TaxID=128251 RepID=A0ABP0URC5_9BRYO
MNHRVYNKIPLADFLILVASAELALYLGLGKAFMVYAEVCLKLLPRCYWHSDPLKQEAAVVVEGLKSMGIKCILVTGNNWQTARSVADEADGTVVAMVGDGINDMPARTAADVGMAIGAGTGIVIEAADYVLMHNSVEDVITATDLSQKSN